MRGDEDAAFIHRGWGKGTEFDIQTRLGNETGYQKSEQGGKGPMKGV